MTARTRSAGVHALIAAAVALGTTAACAAHPEPPATSGGGVTGTITVLAAASLTESFTRIGQDFQAANPKARVRFSFAGSSQLAQQIAAGAPADVFAAASPATMRTVSAAGDAARAPRVFARNQLVIAVPKGNPKGVGRLADLAGPGVRVALCAPQVPCGSAASTALGAAGVRVTPVTQEQDVKAALSKVKLGEVDAALVYRTDIRASAGEVEGIEFPESVAAANDYQIVTTRDAPNPTGATAFAAYVLSDRARRVLTAAGFQAP